MRLIQGIWEREPGQAQRILRRRIFASCSRPGEMDWGMVRVAAKRLRAGVLPEEIPLAAGVQLIELEPLQSPSFVPIPTLPPAGPDSHAAFMAAALGLASEVEKGGSRHLSNRRIAALLVSASGEVLAASVNSSSRNRTRHAEVNLVQAYCALRGTALPEGARIYATLKPCKMCAGMIWDASMRPGSIRVFFAEDDPGPLARVTVLSPASFERLRACAQAPPGTPIREVSLELKLSSGG